MQYAIIWQNKALRSRVALMRSICNAVVIHLDGELLRRVHLREQGIQAVVHSGCWLWTNAWDEHTLRQSEVRMNDVGINQKGFMQSNKDWIYLNLGRRVWVCMYVQWGVQVKSQSSGCHLNAHDHFSLAWKIRSHYKVLSVVNPKNVPWTANKMEEYMGQS